MNKRITSILLCFIMVFSMLVSAVPAYAASVESTQIIITPSKTTANPGDIITYKIKLGPVSDMGTLQMELVIPNGLTYVANSGRLVDGLKAKLGFDDVAFTEVSLVINGVASAADYESATDTELATFQCKVNDGFSGNTEVGLTYLEFYSCQTWTDHTSRFSVVPAVVLVEAAPVAVTGVSIQETLSVNIGQSATPTYVVNPAEATNKAVTFSSNNTAVATVNETTGEVTGVKKGTSVITVKTADGNYTDTCTVTVSCAHAATTPVAAQTSDCKTPGWEAYTTCNACGQILSAQGAELQAIPYLPLSQNHVGGTATCLKKAVCTVCQKEYGNLADHKWNQQEWDYKDENGHAHKCTETGCGEHDSVVSHTPNIPAATEQEAKVCTTCQYVIEPQKQHVHSTTRVPAEPASCTQSGNKEYYTCTCGKYFEDATANVEITNKDSVIIPEKGHDYSERIKDAAHLRTQASNCQEYDTYWYDCSRCSANAKDELTMGDKWYTSTDAGDHIMDRNWTQENDKHFHKCTVNGCTHTDTKTPCSGGTATCQSKATCSTCNNLYGSVAEHKWSQDWTYRQDNGHAKSCTFPGCLEYTTVEPHKPSAWQITDDAHSKYCTDCQYIVYAREAHKDANDDGICDVCNRDSNVIVEIPFVKVVEQTGEATPGKETFVFEIIEFGNSNANGEVDIVANTVTTDGKGKFDGVIKLKLTEEELNDEDYLAEGLYIREKVETKEGWTFSDAVWYALFNEQTGVWEFFVVENNVKANEAKAEMTFTNSYNAKNPTTNTNTTSPTKESPKTGDNNVLGLLVAVMLVSGCGAVAMYVYNKKRRYF